MPNQNYPLQCENVQFRESLRGFLVIEAILLASEGKASLNISSL